ncbi:hypothetical protein K402DRAFT_422760 [Aulographum hederae CBS 113979]|uniref:Uncharacterized protein n=1 Tax=Aulographum hederae CBS 113979 TaxID=1176131 RepID=A0A6G1GUB0_9PEZI|nr:hypothetical protein K402DRAFT_422760 [Aulographum hederae CBS 113979]
MDKGRNNKGQHAGNKSGGNSGGMGDMLHGNDDINNTSNKGGSSFNTHDTREHHNDRGLNLDSNSHGEKGQTGKKL